MRLILIAAAMLLFVPTAQAQSLFDFAKDQETPLIAQKSGSDDDQKLALLESFESNCQVLNTSSSLAPYVERQCACTALNMDAVMSLENLRALGRPGNEGDHQAARLMLLAYGPCIGETAQSLTFDNCMQGASALPSQCRCMADGMEAYTDRSAAGMIPGFVRDHFDRARSVANPLAKIILSEGYSRSWDHYARHCMNIYERNR